MTGQHNHRTQVLIVSHPGIMQQVLKQTFTNRQDLEVAAVAGGSLSATKLIENVKPDLVVIDSNLPYEETRELLQWLKIHYPDIRSLALVETTQQLNEITNAGADKVWRSYSLRDHLDQGLWDLTTRID